MTVKELIKSLEQFPENATVMYRHNKHGRIDIDKVDYMKETLLSDMVFETVTLEGSFEED